MLTWWKQLDDETKWLILTRVGDHLAGIIVGLALADWLR